MYFEDYLPAGELFLFNFLLKIIQSNVLCIDE